MPLKKLWNNPKVRLALVFVLLVVAGISIGVIIESNVAEYQSRQKQQELQQLYTVGSSSQSPSADIQGQPYANPQFGQLLEINPDLIGWLDVGTYSGPVVQTDNNEYYLNHDFYGKEDKHGTIYLDTRNRLDEMDDNLVLYGHNYSKSQQLFYEVEKYKDPAYAAQYPTITFTTLYEKRTYQVFAAFMSNTDPQQGEVFNYHNQLRFREAKAMNTFLADVRARSMIDTNLEVDAYDQLLTLSTCGYDFAGQRYVVVARLLRPGEDGETAVEYTKAENPLLPEAWVRLYGKK